MGASLILFVSVYTVYHLSLLPSTPGGDSGELLSEACVWGTPHPPGYPLFTMMSHFTMKVPVPRVYFAAPGQLAVDWAPTKAWRVNHLCAILGAVTAVLLASCSKSLSRSSRMSPMHCVGSLLFALSPLLWEYSLSAEVFALNNLLCSLLLWLSCRTLDFSSTSTDKESIIALSNAGVGTKSSHGQLAGLIIAGAFTSGLALANQHTSLILIVVLVPSVILSAIKPLQSSAMLVSTLLYSLMAFLVAFSSYAYLFFASLKPKEGSWGDLTSARGLVRHILRSEYGTFQLGAGRDGSESANERIVLYLKHASNESLYVGLALAVLAMVQCIVAVLMTRNKSLGDRAAVTGNSTTTATTAAAAAAAAKGKTKGKDLSPRPKLGNKVPPSFSSAPAAPASTTPIAALVLSGSWFFYSVVWHCTLSNLPLSSPMPFGVHARFWMQPNLILAVLTGVGAHTVGCWAVSRSRSRSSRGSSGRGTEHSVTAGLSRVNVNVNGMAALEWALFFALFAAILRWRFPVMNRAKSGWLIHRYALAALRSLPPQSLLLSHTDLDWNPMRYLRVCEGERPDVTHLSFQMMPYPWFKTAQQPLHPQVQFPDFAFRGVSTERGSEGNAKLVRDMVLSNGALSHTLEFLGMEPNIAADHDPDQEQGKKHKKKMPPPTTPFPGGIFIDFQSVADVELGDGHQWRGLQLMPFGTLYRVVAVELAESAALHPASLTQLRSLQASMSQFASFTLSSTTTKPASSGATATTTTTTYTSTTTTTTADAVVATMGLGSSVSALEQFQAGTWEFAALSVVNDASYHVGMALLTFAMSQQKALKAENLGLLVLLVDRLHVASEVLTATYAFALGGHGGMLLSSPVFDVCKNAALAWMRLVHLQSMLVDFRQNVLAALAGDDGQAYARLFLLGEETIMGQVATSAGLLESQTRAAQHITAFLKAYPSDKDEGIFRDFRAKITKNMKSRGI